MFYAKMFCMMIQNMGRGFIYLASSSACFNINDFLFQNKFLTIHVLLLIEYNFYFC